MSNKFTFNASAIGLGGVITENGCTTVIPSLASVALAPTGGEGSSRVENYCVNGISFSRAETRVIGYETSENVFTTTTDILLTNLNIRDRLKIALMQATITSTRRLDAEDSDFNLHAIYRGIERDGDEIEPTLDVELCSGPSGKPTNFKQFVEKVRSNLDASVPVMGGNKERLERALYDGREPLLTSLVTSTDVRRGGKVVSTYAGNELVVSDLGSAFLGELIVKRGRRRINLLRFEFGGLTKQSVQPHPNAAITADGPVVALLDGPGVGGALTAGSGDGNGQPVWPGR
jgi:hypothetical protein